MKSLSKIEDAGAYSSVMSADDTPSKSSVDGRPRTKFHARPNPLDCDEESIALEINPELDMLALKKAVQTSFGHTPRVFQPRIQPSESESESSSSRIVPI
jgi:hypothetical protein